MHEYDHSASGEQKQLFARKPSSPWLPNKHILPQVADTHTLATEQTHIVTESHAASTDFGPTRINLHYASILTAGPSPPIQHSTWLMRVQHRCTSCESGERGIDPTVRDLHDQDDWSCKSSKAASIRSHPDP